MTATGAATLAGAGVRQIRRRVEAEAGRERSRPAQGEPRQAPCRTSARRRGRTSTAVLPAADPSAVDSSPPGNRQRHENAHALCRDDRPRHAMRNHHAHGPRPRAGREGMRGYQGSDRTGPSPGWQTTARRSGPEGPPVPAAVSVSNPATCLLPSHEANRRDQFLDLVLPVIAVAGSEGIGHAVRDVIT